MKLTIFFFIFTFVVKNVFAQNCSLTEHQIDHLKQSLLCLAEESPQGCKQATGIGLSTTTKVAGAIGAVTAGTVAAQMWRARGKACGIPGFSFNWIGMLSTVANAALNCYSPHMILDGLYKDVHPQVSELLKNNVENAKNQKPNFLRDEESFRKELLFERKVRDNQRVLNQSDATINPKYRELKRTMSAYVAKPEDLRRRRELELELVEYYASNSDDAEIVEAIADKRVNKLRELSKRDLPLSLQEQKELLVNGYKKSFLDEIEANRKARIETITQAEKLAKQHTQIISKLKQGQNYISASDAKVYAKFVEEIPNPSSTIRDKINYVNFVVDTHETNVAGGGAKYAAKKRIAQESLEHGLKKIGARVGAHFIPGANGIAFASDAVDIAGVAYNVAVPNLDSCGTQSFSKYSRVDENCRPVMGKHQGVLDFLSEEDWKVQNRALSADPDLCTNMKSIYSEFVNPPYQATCSDNGFKAKTDSQISGIQIEGTQDRAGNLAKLIFEANELSPEAVDNRRFAMTYKDGVMEELRYRNLSPSTAMKYNTGFGDKQLNQAIATFSDPQYYKSHKIKDLDPENPRGRKAISQVQENNFFITEIMGCCDKNSNLPGNKRCEAYGIKRGSLGTLSPAAGATGGR
ncbi:MAG: hypothetical protein AABY64_14255 [Bdellovibrionota bacterium]